MAPGNMRDHGLSTKFTPLLPVPYVAAAARITHTLKDGLNQSESKGSKDIPSPHGLYMKGETVVNDDDLSLLDAPPGTLSL